MSRFSQLIKDLEQNDREAQELADAVSWLEIQE